MGSKKKSRPDPKGLDDPPQIDARPPLLQGFAGGLKAAVPIMLGYFPTAAAFGLVARETGLGVIDAVLVSVVVFAGASQFALVGLVAAGSTVPVAAATLLFLNARHLLYGASLAPRLRMLGALRAAVGAFGLTDEVFAVCSAKRDRKISFGWLLGLEVGAYVSWVAGTWIGATGGAVVSSTLPSLRPALSFALPALFLALLVLLLSGSVSGPSRSRTAVAAAIAAGTAAVLHLTGWGGWSVLAAGVAGPVVAVAVGKTLRRSNGGG